MSVALAVGAGRTSSYQIKNKAGELVAVHHRIDQPDGRKRIWWTRGEETGLQGLSSSDLPLYGIEELVPGGVVFLCEGEKAADALAERGRASVATVCGASTTPSDTVLSDLMVASKVVVWPDFDIVGKEHMRRIVDRLAVAGIKTQTLEWGEQKGDDAYDFFARGHSVAELDEMVLNPPVPTFDPDATALEHGELPPNGVREFPMALRANEFVEAEIAAPRWLVDGIWPDQGIGFISGQPKVFKSFLALDMAFAVATGEKFLGIWPVQSPQTVLVVQNESSKTAFRDRIREMAKRFGGVPQELCLISNYPILLDDKTWVERMTRELEKVRPALLVLDPLASMTTVDENSAQEIGAVVRLLRGWRDQFGCAICVVHHEVKDGAGRRAGQKLRGSGALYGAAEVVVSMNRPDDDAPRVAVHIGLKESESPQPFFAEFIGDGAELRVLTEEKLVATEQAIRELIAARGEITVADIASALNLKPQTAREAVKTIRGIRLKPGTGTSNKAAVYYLESQTVVPIRLGVTED